MTGSRWLSPMSLAVLLLVILLAVVPPAVGGFLPRALSGYLIFGLLALSVGLISGYGRLFNLGVGANFGISAYAVAAITQFGITNPVVLLLGSLGSAGAGFEEWLSFQRPSLHDEFVDVVSRAIQPDSALTRQQRDFCARRLLRADPCHEGAYRALMRGAAESGHVSVVRHLFDDCTRKLMDELGVGPDEQTVRLFEALTKGGTNEGLKQTVRSH